LQPQISAEFYIPKLREHRAIGKFDRISIRGESCRLPEYGAVGPRFLFEGLRRPQAPAAGAIELLANHLMGNGTRAADPRMTAFFLMKPRNTRNTRKGLRRMRGHQQHILRFHPFPSVYIRFAAAVFLSVARVRVSVAHVSVRVGRLNAELSGAASAAPRPAPRVR
jgi:hypothetical protein